MIIVVNFILVSVLFASISFLKLGNEKVIFAIIVATVSAFLIFNCANLFNARTEIGEKIQIKEVLTNHQVLTYENTTIVLPEMNIIQFNKLKENINDNEEYVYYLVKYKKVNKIFDNTFFNRRFSENYDVLSIEDMD